jgi:hypothetical protein
MVFSVLRKGLPSVLLVGTLLSGNAAFSKQCVWNKSGFVLNVTWIAPDGQVARVDQFPTAQGRCTGDEPVQYTAALSVAYGELADIITKSAVIAAAAALSGGAAAGASLTATGAAGVAGSGALMGQVGARGIPNPKGLFWTGSPSLDGRYLDVWGTIWDPQVGPGGSI